MSEINLVQLVLYLLPRLTAQVWANLINGLFMLQNLRQDLTNLVYNTGLSIHTSRGMKKSHNSL